MKHSLVKNCLKIYKLSTTIRYNQVYIDNTITGSGGTEETTLAQPGLIV